MGIFLNYLFIGFVLTFLLDYFSFKYKNHPSWANVPDWGWGARIAFAIFWPIGLFLFIYTYIKEITK